MRACTAAAGAGANAGGGSGGGGGRPAIAAAGIAAAVVSTTVVGRRPVGRNSSLARISAIAYCPVAVEVVCDGIVVVPASAGRCRC